jgi:hypothetical protein
MVLLGAYTALPSPAHLNSCRLCSHHESVGSVQTGGQFARSRLLPIHQCGLTLSEAVEQTIREGVRTSAGTTATHFEQPRSVSAVTQQDRVEGHIRDFRDLVGKNDNALAEKAGTIYDNVYKNVVENSSDLRSRAIEVIVNILKSSLPDTTSGVNEVSLDAEIRTKILEAMNEIAVARPQQASTTPAPKADMTYYQTAVRLRRKKGNTLVFPLWLVDRFEAGDVALRDGDVIDVSHYSRSELFNGTFENTSSLRTFSDENYSNTTILEANELDRYIDLLRVTHVNREGVTEEYYIPKNNNQAFGENPGYAFMLNQALVSDDDAISPENLALSSVIRAGRREALQRSAELLNPKDFSQRLDDGNRALEESLSKVPVVGDICRLVESTTGLSAADAFANTQECIENAVSLIPTPY